MPIFVHRGGYYMTIKNYINIHNYSLLNINHKGVNYEFKNVRESKHSCISIYIIFDEKFALKKMSGNIYKLVNFCRLEEFNEQIDKISEVYDYDFFEIEMLDKNDKNYVVQFNRNKYSLNEKSTLRIYDNSGSGDCVISNPYGPAFVSFKNYEIIKTRFYLLGKELSEFEIEVLKATKV